MSRVVMLQLDERDVVAACVAAKVGISVVERLPEGGVRLVCMSSAGAVAMRRKFKSKLIAIEPRRERHRPATPLW
jgi:acyl-CoA synthetase (NDP forming)